MRDPSRAPQLPGAEVVQADYRDPESVREALYPGDRVFMVATHQGVEDRIESHRSFIQAASDVGVGLVAYLSIVNASRDSKFPHSWSHRATEELLEAAPVPHAFLRMNLFLDDLPLWFDADGICRGPAGDGRVALISRADVAAVAAAVLASDGYLGETLDLSGDEAPTVAEFAAICSELTGRACATRPARGPTTSRAAWRWAASPGMQRPAPAATWPSRRASWPSRPTSSSASPAASPSASAAGSPRTSTSSSARATARRPGRSNRAA